MTSAIGPNSRGSILPGLDQVQQKFDSPFLQACGMSNILKGADISALFNIQSVALANAVKPPALFDIANKMPSVFQNKGQGKGK